MSHLVKVVALALLVLSSALSAAETKPPEIPIIGETIDVRVVNVEVVATSGGELVRGLTAADFRLLIDGKEVPIEFFTEVAEGTAAPSAAGPAAPWPRWLRPRRSPAATWSSSTSRSPSPGRVTPCWRSWRRT